MRAVFLVLTKLYWVWINRFIMAGRVVERGELPFLYLMAESLISLPTSRYLTALRSSSPLPCH